MQWHEAMPLRWTQEQSIAAAMLQDFEAGIDGNGCAFVRGTFSVVSEHGHLYEIVGLRIVYPSSFPARNQPPTVYLESHHDRWVKGGDSHIENDWRICLFVPFESGIDFSETTSLNDLFAVIHTFLFKQRVYQRRLVRSRLDGSKAEWPGEDRSHGLQGIREAIRDGGGIGRNDPCPCGSGKKFKRCHLGKL
jgi:hypothetical protein